MSENNLSLFEKSIGYCFKDKQKLMQALTHSSYANENGLPRNYERLEFLGDAVLELLVSDLLYKKYPDMSEGDLTKMRASIVCEPHLADMAVKLGLGDHILLGKGEAMTGGRTRPSILSDVMEAVIGAVYVDGGFLCAKRFVKTLMTIGTAVRQPGMVENDYKSQIQEVLQRDSAAPIYYDIIKTDGPDHEKIFHAQLRHGQTVLGVGKGKSKKLAEQDAAFQALQATGEK